MPREHPSSFLLLAYLTLWNVALFFDWALSIAYCCLMLRHFARSSAFSGDKDMVFEKSFIDGMCILFSSLIVERIFNCGRALYTITVVLMLLVAVYPAKTSEPYSFMLVDGIMIISATVSKRLQGMLSYDAHGLVKNVSTSVYDGYVTAVNNWNSFVYFSATASEIALRRYGPIILECNANFVDLFYNSTQTVIKK